MMVKEAVLLIILLFINILDKTVSIVVVYLIVFFHRIPPFRTSRKHAYIILTPLNPTFVLNISITAVRWMEITCLMLF